MKMDALTAGLKYFIESHDDNGTESSQSYYTIQLSACIKVPHSLKYKIKSGLEMWKEDLEILDIKIEEIDNPSNIVPIVYENIKESRFIDNNTDTPHKVITVRPPKQDKNKSVSHNIDIVYDFNMEDQDNEVSQAVIASSDGDNNDDDDVEDDFKPHDDSDDSWNPQREYKLQEPRSARLESRPQRSSTRIKSETQRKNRLTQVKELEDVSCRPGAKMRFKGSFDTETSSSGEQEAVPSTKQRRSSKQTTTAMATESSVQESEAETVQKILVTGAKTKSSRRKTKTSTEDGTRTRRRSSGVKVKHILTCKLCGDTFDKIRNYNFHLETHETKIENNQDQTYSSSSSHLIEPVSAVQVIGTITAQETKLSLDPTDDDLAISMESSLHQEAHQTICIVSKTETEDHKMEDSAIVQNSTPSDISKETKIKFEESGGYLDDGIASSANATEQDDCGLGSSNSCNEQTSVFEIWQGKKEDEPEDESKEEICDNPVSKRKKDYDILICEDCGKYFSRIDVYVNHMLTHSTVRAHQCLKCDKTFKTKPSLTSHELTAHSGQIHHCDVCNKYFTLKSTLKSHIATVHNLERNEICHICGKGFSRKEHLRKHISLHSDFKPFKCDFCDRHFQSEVLLRTHTKHHLLEAKHICDICGRAFKTPSNLKSHQLSHSGIRNFTCTTCNMAFLQKASLKKHLRTHDLNRKVVQCNICGKIFKNQSNLNRHNITAHSDLKPFQCEFCSKTFKLKSLLDQHANLHKMEKDYSCKYCDKKFAFNSSLYSHVKCHHKDKLNVSDLESGVKCYLCGNYFESNFALASHVRTHNNNVRI